MASPGAAPDFSIKRGDRKPFIRVILGTRNADGTESPVNLSAASAVRFIMKAPGVATAAVDGLAIVENASSGIVYYEWAAGDTDTARPDYRAEFEVEFADTTKETFPSRGYLTIEVEEDLG